MSFFEGLSKFVEYFAVMTDTEDIDVEHPKHSPLADMVAGTFVRRRDEKGLVDYQFHKAPRVELYKDVAALVRDHLFDDVLDMAKCLTVTGEQHAEVFIKCASAQRSIIRCVIDRAYPAKGTMSCIVERHPSFARWFSKLGKTEANLTHQALTDLLLDNQDDLADPKVAQAVKRFRAVKEIQYDADLGGEGHEAVKVVYKGQRAEGELELPSEFGANIAPFIGVWEPGDEPRIYARFTVRVVPSPSGGAEPLFRIRWVNFAEYELAANDVLHDAVKIAFGDTPDGVYRGSPDVTRYFLPRTESKTAEK